MGAPSYGGGMNEPAQEGSALDAIRQQTSKLEDMMDTLAEPVKPYVITKDGGSQVIQAEECAADDPEQLHAYDRPIPDRRYFPRGRPAYTNTMERPTPLPA